MTNISETYLTYAIKNGKLTSIEDVESGLACGCVCPSCKERMVARKGNINAHHFAHYNAGDCGKSYETSLHLLAKEILSQNSQIMLPSLSMEKYFYTGTSVVNISDDSKISSNPNYDIWRGRAVAYNEVRLEERLGDIIPDIVIYFEQDKPLALEIFVTHKIDEDKLEKIKSQKLSTIEVDLSGFNRSIQHG